MSVFISDLGTSPYLSETVPSELDWTTENWPSAPGKQGTMGRLSTKNFLALRTVGIWPNNSVKIIPKTWNSDQHVVWVESQKDGDGLAETLW